ncbi:hypothetical protein I4P11_09045 [Enterobacter hormaechei]|uniref:hypothetical protein n=1 Tax=Enterobacter hormaechei TaxID=158836 RepID=UPI0018C2EAA8|nr:hypothetical protein [Enterobacter hormaechei]MBG0672938.1 hypothetical protein [Enterobacter hormaechei]HDS5274970.1 hypothetical protein [Enterobacter hormaechei subsp. steigerwaltii]
MITLTKEWLMKTIAELEEERDATPGVVNEDAAMAIAAMKLAMASLEAEPVSFNALRDAVAEVSGGPAMEWSDIYKGHQAVPFINFNSLARIVEKFRTATPAPVAVPDEYVAAVPTPTNLGYEAGGNACRAAMLQGAETVTTACKLRDAVEIIRNSGIAIDAEKILAERDALNSPDCWCHTCRPVTMTDMRFVVCPECGNKRCPHANDHRNACTGSNEPGQEGSAYPTAPQQEAKDV